jgi:hypothetical protein
MMPLQNRIILNKDDMPTSKNHFSVQVIGNEKKKIEDLSLRPQVTGVQVHSKVF